MISLQALGRTRRKHRLNQGYRDCGPASSSANAGSEGSGRGPAAARRATTGPLGYGMRRTCPALILIGIAQYVFVGVEDFHVGASVAESLLGDLAERIARFDGVRLRGRARGPDRRGSRRTDLNVGHDVLLPVGNRFDRVPDRVLVRLGGDRALEVQLTVRSSALPWNFPLLS